MEKMNTENIRTIINDSVEEIEGNYDLIFDSVNINEVEFRSKDGFIPFTDGGVSVNFFCYLENIINYGNVSREIKNKINIEVDKHEKYIIELFEEENNIKFNSYSELSDDLQCKYSDLETENGLVTMVTLNIYYYRKNNPKNDFDTDSFYIELVYNTEDPYYRSKFDEVIYQKSQPFISEEDLLIKLAYEFRKINKLEIFDLDYCIDYCEEV